jgi:hypothetical protein
MSIELNDLSDAIVCSECGTVWKDKWPKVTDCPTCKLRNKTTINPCPFCKEEKRLYVLPADYAVSDNGSWVFFLRNRQPFPREYSVVWCKSCNTHGPYESTPIRAIKSWNAATFKK